jgi:hypothetical protein
METYTTIMLARADFEDLMKRDHPGERAKHTEVFARIAALNAAGHLVRIIDKSTGELIHEFLPKAI